MRMLHFGETGGSCFVRPPTRNLREARKWAQFTSTDILCIYFSLCVSGHRQAIGSLP